MCMKVQRSKKKEKGGGLSSCCRSQNKHILVMTCGCESWRGIDAKLWVLAELGSHCSLHGPTQAIWTGIEHSRFYPGRDKGFFFLAQNIHLHVSFGTPCVRDRRLVLHYCMQ